MTQTRAWAQRAIVVAIWGMLLVVAAPAATDAVDSVVAPVSLHAAASVVQDHPVPSDAVSPVRSEVLRIRRVISASDLRRRAAQSLRDLVLPGLAFVVYGLMRRRNQRRGSVDAVAAPSHRWDDARGPPR